MKCAFVQTLILARQCPFVRGTPLNRAFVPAERAQHTTGLQSSWAGSACALVLYHVLART